MKSLTLLCILLVLALCTFSAHAKTKHQKMFEDLYLKTEDELLASNFIATYATLVHRNIIADFLIPSPSQEATWGTKTPFIVNNPQPVNLALATGKLKIADQIIREVEKRKPRGYYDQHPAFAGRLYPLETEEELNNPHIPTKWIEHQFVTSSILFSEDTTREIRGLPAMGMCVLTRSEECFDVLHYQHNFKPTLTSNSSYNLDVVMLAAQLNAYELIPKLVDIGAPFDMQERSYVLTPTSPFLMACSGGHVEFVEKLYQMGWDLDETNGEGGDTCLHVAAQIGSARLTAWLVDHGADISIVHEKDGQSAYSLSVMYHHRDVQNVLAGAFLEAKLPLPRPPTIRQMIQDYTHQDEITRYIDGMLSRTGKTREEAIQQMDMVHYDPYYDYNGSYDPNAYIGNVDENLPADVVPGTGTGGFLTEIDGVFYRAGTYSYRKKMLEVQEREAQEKIDAQLARTKERESLLAFVDRALQKRREEELKSFQEKQNIPEQVKAQMRRQGQVVDEELKHTMPESSAAIFSTKLLKDEEKKQQQQQPKTTKDEL